MRFERFMVIGGLGPRMRGDDEVFWKNWKYGLVTKDTPKRSWAVPLIYAVPLIMLDELVSREFIQR